MRKQYHFRKSKNGYFAWDVEQLLALSKGFLVFEIDTSEIKEFDQTYWYSEASDVPTCRSSADHMKLAHESDLDFPIILAADGTLTDGMHRVCKAYLNDVKYIRAVKFEVTPNPDFVDILPHQLPY